MEIKTRHNRRDEVVGIKVKMGEFRSSDQYARTGKTVTLVDSAMTAGPLSVSFSDFCGMKVGDEIKKRRFDKKFGEFCTYLMSSFS